MLQHNLLLIYRNFKRFKGTFLINLTGLSTGLACALLIYLWVSDELSVDRFHQKDKRLFQVVERIRMADKIEIVPHTAGLLGEAIEEKIPEAEYTVSSRLLREDKILSVGDNNIKASGLYASRDFFNMFSYDLVQGDKEFALADKNAIVISEKLAGNLFHTRENVIGKMVEFQHGKQYMVSGVFKGTPPNSSIQFDFVLSYEEFKEINPNAVNWTYNSSTVYVVLKEGSGNIEEFNDKIADFVKNRTGDSLRTLTTRPYSEPYLYGDYENGVVAGGRIEYVRLFSIIAVSILLIACINFMNLSTAKASRRLKEIGVKKTFGADRKILIRQYLGESMLVTFLSLLVAILLVQLSLPQFNQITGKQIALSFDIHLILSALSITVFTGLVAGSYPALYLSGFSPATVLKGKLNSFVGQLWARKGLVVFQFTFSIVLISGVLVVYKQIEFIQTKNLGYEKNNVLYFEIEGRVAESMETFLSEMRNIPGIVNASSIGQNIVGSGLNTFSIDHWEGKKTDDRIVFEVRPVGYGMIETLGIQMAAGRSYSENFSAEDSKIIFNEAAIEAMGLEDPIGKTITIQGTDLEIIGVTNNFHFASLHEEVNPLFFVLRPSWTKKIMAKIEAGKERECIEQLQRFYKEYNPGFPFAYQFLDEAYQAQYVAEHRVGTLARYFAGLAVVISCLGLFGLAAYTAERRLKEIGIRKILGSSQFGIVYLFSSEFASVVFVSIVMALPLSYFIAKYWLDSFAFRIELEWLYFIGAGLMAMIVALLTVGVQAVKAARVNPLNNLRTE